METTEGNPPRANPTSTVDELKPLKFSFDQVLCRCPQKCYERVPQGVRDNLYSKFDELKANSEQNDYLQSYIEMRSVFKRLWAQEERIGGRLQRRVSCKYRIPLDSGESGGSIQTKIDQDGAPRVLAADEERTIEVCQKAFMNIYRITEKRIRLQREKLITKFRSKPTDVRPNLLQKIKKIEEWSPERAKLEAFFVNQLWRPEYIGMSTDSETPDNETFLDSTQAQNICQNMSLHDYVGRFSNI